MVLTEPPKFKGTGPLQVGNYDASRNFAFHAGCDVSVLTEPIAKAV